MWSDSWAWYIKCAVIVEVDECKLEKRKDKLGKLTWWMRNSQVKMDVSDVTKLTHNFQK